ncbi:hypothetical protein PVK06_000526 [Gossypium arboreum]|uniref:Sulfotransferase n=1 Tax=Gossypium arboreum TaxID=29729 RepID=A0ABR0QYK0_GOSAR|nr:hypothetical protein PVK06_000526 [Gossypium arboreum]
MHLMEAHTRRWTPAKGIRVHPSANMFIEPHSLLKNNDLVSSGVIFWEDLSMEYSSFPSAFSTLFGELLKETWCCSDLYNWERLLTGTTWLKAIIPTIMNPMGRMNDDNNDPLLKRHPNELMPSLEVQLFKENPNPDLSYMPSPRIFRTHVPYPMLPESVKNSACKIVYITRDPKDMFVSLWDCLNSLVTTQGNDPWPMDEAFDSFCRGVHVFGPFHDHV